MISKKTKINIIKKLSVCSLSLMLLCSVTAMPVYAAENDKTSIQCSISRHPKAADYNRGKLKEIPKDDSQSGMPFQLDFRSTDVSDLDFTNKSDVLKKADFDSKTVWPSSLPSDFNPDKIMEYGKNPGLNIRKVHESGITGKGVGIAIIDSALLVDHSEYKNNIKSYEEIGKVTDESEMHGPAVTSIAAGKNVGVAPDADIYYFAANPGTIDEKGNCTYDFTNMAKAIDKVIEYNKNLPADKKIRVISISVGWMKDQKGFKEIDEAVKRAKADNILVVSSDISLYYDVKLDGLYRDELKDPDDPANYQPGLFGAKYFYLNYSEERAKHTIMLPMDDRCLASPTGNDDYAYYTSGGISWSIPYLSGLYALACQADPQITPEEFLHDVIETGTINDISKDGKNYKMGTIANPQNLISKLTKDSSIR